MPTIYEPEKSPIACPKPTDKVVTRRKPRPLGHVEFAVLVKLLDIQPVDSYAQAIFNSLEPQPTLGAVYMALSRLEKKTLAVSHWSTPTHARGGRSRRHYAITPQGRAAVERTRRAYDSHDDKSS